MCRSVCLCLVRHRQCVTLTHKDRGSRVWRRAVAVWRLRPTRPKLMTGARAEYVIFRALQLVVLLSAASSWPPGGANLAGCPREPLVRATLVRARVHSPETVKGGWPSGRLASTVRVCKFQLQPASCPEWRLAYKAGFCTVRVGLTLCELTKFYTHSAMGKCARRTLGDKAQTGRKSTRATASCSHAATCSLQTNWAKILQFYLHFYPILLSLSFVLPVWPHLCLALHCLALFQLARHSSRSSFEALTHLQAERCGPVSGPVAKARVWAGGNVRVVPLVVVVFRRFVGGQFGPPFGQRLGEARKRVRDRFGR